MAQPPLVLIIDDSPKILLLVEQLLAGNGMRAVTAEGGAAGLTAAQKDRPDLILLDLVMPGMDGYGVLDGLKAAGLKIPVIVVSGKEMIEDVEKAFAKGAVDYVRKPYEDARLLLKVRKHLGKHAKT